MTSSDALTLLNAIYDSIKFSPSKWEVDFLISTRELAEEGIKLTTRQGEVLESIYRKAYKDEY